MIFKKKISAVICAFLVVAVQINASASILGNLTGGYKEPLSTDVMFHEYNYNTDTTTQAEYYVEYEPTEEVVPVVINGDAIYGKRTIKEAAKYMRDNGLKPMIGINADFFSLQTGIPMGHTIIDGNVVTSDTSGQNAIGFNDDGTAFVSWLEIQNKITKADGSFMMVDCVNKWCQPTISAAYFLTDHFGASTKTSGNCKFIIFSKVEGDMSIGGKLKLRVDEMFDYEGDILIPEDKYVLVMTNTYGDADKLAFMAGLQIDDEITFTSESVYDKEKWAKAKHGMGSIGGRLIENGVVNTEFTAGTAPRTAVGIKADGKLVFYVIDGRQKEHSTGVQIKTLAKRMAELGCVEAINLDGGGSTAIAGVFPGSSELSVANKPSDGNLRKCANYIFLKDMRKNVPETFKINVPENRKLLSGYEESLDSVYVTNSAGKTVNGVEILYSAENSNTILLEEGKITAKNPGSEFVNIQAGNSVKHVLYTVYSTPNQIKAYSGGKEVKGLTFIKNEKGIVDLDAASFVYGSEIKSDDSCYVWSCDESIGEIDKNGVFAASTEIVQKGNIYIRAGEKTLAVPVTIEDPSVFEDMKSHWAKDFANELYHMGIITGEDKDGALVYRPENNITRGEFACIIARYMNLDITGTKKQNFADYDFIPDWQKPYVNAVAKAGYIKGRETDGKLYFSGNDPISRAEAMTILYRTSGEDKHFADVQFKDGNKIPDYAKEAVNALVGLGIVNGYEDGKLMPLGNVTRAECAAIIFKAKNIF